MPWFWWMTLGCVLVTAFAAVLYPALNRKDGVRSIDSVTNALGGALSDYKVEFGSFPEGDSRSVSKALQGDNPKHKRFIALRHNEISPDGDILDPWGTPYLFYFSGDLPLIRSAGENRQLDDSTSRHFDDYIRG